MLGGRDGEREGRLSGVVGMVTCMERVWTWERDDWCILATGRCAVV